ncbi:MAG: DUF4276 family protein [Candidatus Acidiferrales bacterium]
MTRVYVVVEGRTEESFITNVLARALWGRQVYLTPIILGAPGHKGGNVNYARVRKDVVLLLKQDPTAYCSTMLDFYGMGQDFPGLPLSPNLPNIEKVTRIENAVRRDIIAEVPDRRPETRFLPYLQLHEYEGLLFSDPVAFASVIGQEHVARQLQAIRNDFDTPEDINDGVNSAPSKRVLATCPAYRKVLDGTLAAETVGIDKMRQECPHFRGWIETIEALGTP